MKIISFLQTVLCLNTSLTVFLSGLSRKGVPQSELYSAASAVVSAEFLKLVMCFLLLALTENGKTSKKYDSYHMKCIKLNSLTLHRFWACTADLPPRGHRQAGGERQARGARGHLRLPEQHPVPGADVPRFGDVPSDVPAQDPDHGVILRARPAQGVASAAVGRSGDAHRRSHNRAGLELGFHCDSPNLLLALHLSGMGFIVPGLST